MSREKRNSSEMFKEFIQLGCNVRNLNSIIKNDEEIVSEDELMDWVDLVNENINKINSLKEDIIRFYQD